MKIEKVNQIFADTAYIRMGGTKEELRCAEYLKTQCEEYGCTPYMETFEVDRADMKQAVLIVDGEEVVCKGYFGAGTAEVEASFYYLRGTDPFALSQCKGKIVMIDGILGYWKYQDLLEAGAVGFITHSGNANYIDEEIDQKELRAYVHKGNKIPGVNINTKKAIQLIKKGAKEAKIVLKQEEYKGESRNVILDLPGECEKYLVLTAHYDSTSLSQGAYDNMSGSIGLLALAEKFAKEPHYYGIRLIWCGSEERGLLGSKAYTEAHEAELEQVVLNVNLDMIGCIMGNFIACCTTEEKLVHYLEYFGQIEGFGMKAYQDVYSSDSTPFADKGVPSLSFARIAPNNTATIHNSYDTVKVMSARQMLEDISFICHFVETMANAKHLPVSREIPENIKEKLDFYNCRKRDPKTK